MEERSNKTIICSVLFLDIVEYSKKSVTGQISLKDRFNKYLSEAIHDVPVADRIILDTGDGAAVNFLGDVEAALTAALRLRASLLSEDPSFEPQLLVRIGINLGPVRLVRDINGQPNIVGDGINVAQRVMGFADASQILVSRSYYDAVSRLSAQYTGMFHYQGSRTDKHVREHEIYAIGYPGDQTSKHLLDAAESNQKGETSGSAGEISNLPGALLEKIKQASAVQRVMYAVIPVALMLAAAVALWPRQPDEIQPVSQVETLLSSASSVLAASSVSAASGVQANAHEVEVKPGPDKQAAHVAEKTKHQAVQTAEKKVADKKPAASLKSAEKQLQGKNTESSSGKIAGATGSPDAVEQAYISVACRQGAQVFVGGVQKGRVGAEPLMVTVKPGKHKIIITDPGFGIYSTDVDLKAGKTERLVPKACN